MSGALWFQPLTGMAKGHEAIVECRNTECQGRWMNSMGDIESVCDPGFVPPQTPAVTPTSTGDATASPSPSLTATSVPPQETASPTETVSATPTTGPAGRAVYLPSTLDESGRYPNAAAATPCPPDRFWGRR